MATHSSILAWRSPMDKGALWATVHWVTESDMTEVTQHTCKYVCVCVYPYTWRDIDKYRRYICTKTYVSYMWYIPVYGLYGSKLGKEYIKDIYRHSAYLTYMQSTSCEMPGWMKQKLESRCWKKYE